MPAAAGLHLAPRLRVYVLTARELEAVRHEGELPVRMDETLLRAGRVALVRFDVPTRSRPALAPPAHA